MALPHSFKRYKVLPDHLLHKNILPRLPFKYLNTLKCISKELHALISSDAKFAADQSLSANTSSSGFVYMNNDVLSFFPDPALIGVPDPSLKFLNPTSYNEMVKLVSCTNGLLLLDGQFSHKTSLCVCNPAMKDMTFIPKSVDWKEYSICEMVLSYDPCEFPDKFTIVQPLLCNHRNGHLYQFEVFHSDTGKWTRSSQRVNLGSYWAAVKAVCVKGVIYWCCLEHLLWYDTKRDLAGYVVLPAIEDRIHVGVYAGEIMLCNAWVDGVEVWRLTGGSRWDRLHATSWHGMLDAFNLCHRTKVYLNSQSEMFFRQHIILPVGFDGQFVYITVRLKNRDSTSRLFCWETETGRIEEKGTINLTGSWYLKKSSNMLTAWLKCHKFSMGLLS